MNEADQIAALKDQIFGGAVSHQLAVTARRLTKLFAARYAATCQVTTAEWRTLAVLAEQGTVSPSAVSAASDMDKVSVSRAVASLTNRGLVKQTIDPRDGRVRLLVLTRKGIAAHAAAERLTREVEALLFAGLSKTDFAALQKGIMSLDARAQKLSANVAG